MDHSPREGLGGLLIAGLQPELLDDLRGLECLGSIRSEFAAGQQEALRIAHCGDLDVAVVNRMLSDGDGLTVTSLLKEIVPDLLVIVTGEGCDRQEELRAYASGASLYLPHPIHAGHLAQIIVSCMHRHALMSGVSPV